MYIHIYKEAVVNCVPVTTGRIMTERIMDVQAS